MHMIDVMNTAIEARYPTASSSWPVAVTPCGAGRTLSMSRRLSALAISLLAPRAALAFVPIPIGGHAGELDLALQLGLERGKIEPNENQDSWQRSRGFVLYT